MSTCRRRTIQLSKNAKYRKRRFSSDLVATATADIGRQPADAEFDAHIFRCGNQGAAGSTSPKLNLKSNNTLQRRSVAPQAVARLVWLPGIWAGNRWGSSRWVNPLASNPIRKPCSYHPPVYASTPRVPVLQLAIFKTSMASEGMQEEFFEMFSLYVCSVGLPVKLSSPIARLLMEINADPRITFRKRPPLGRASAPAELQFRTRYMGVRIYATSGASSLGASPALK